MVEAAPALVQDAQLYHQRRAHEQFCGRAREARRRGRSKQGLDKRAIMLIHRIF